MADSAVSSLHYVFQETKTGEAVWSVKRVMKELTDCLNGKQEMVESRNKDMMIYIYTAKSSISCVPAKNIIGLVRLYTTIFLFRFIHICSLFLFNERLHHVGMARPKVHIMTSNVSWMIPFVMYFSTNPIISLRDSICRMFCLLLLVHLDINEHI